MSTSTENTSATSDTITTFAGACRENTGSHFLDSGGTYGRHHEKPPIDTSAAGITWDADCSATIETSAFLSEALEIDREIQERFEEWEAENGDDLSWFESGENFCSDVLGLYSAARDNVYNGENDLSQVYVWEVWTEEETPSDWLYAENALTVIYVHTGCDVRGGYGRPIFCRGRGDYPIPVDLCAEYYPVIAQLDGENLEPHDVPGVDRWQSGYSSYPYGELDDAVKRWFEFTRTASSVCVQLHSGELVKVEACMPYMGQ